MERIKHFGVWLKKSDKNEISRENYAIIDKKSSTWYPSKSSYYTAETRPDCFEDEECKFYTDSFCQEWQEKCLINFDKNMEFFKQIPREAFNAALEQLIGSNKNAQQIFDLNDCKKMHGIYVLVLDKYKQVYIGQSRDIKSRIISHWNKQKEFDRLLWGGLNHSVLSIDSFGALDTTRIFVLETDLLDASERFAVHKMPPHFRLNRIGGGTIDNNLDFLIALGEWNLRSLENCHNEEHAEQYEKEMDITYFISQGYCDSQEISVDDVVCVEQAKKGASATAKWYGKVSKVNKTRLYLHPYYCGPILGNSCYSMEYKEEKLLPEEFRINKHMRFSKVTIEEKKEMHTFWRSKKFPHLEA